jgi:hypothetical protein
METEKPNQTTYTGRGGISQCALLLLKKCRTNTVLSASFLLSQKLPRIYVSRENTSEWESVPILSWLEASRLDCPEM